MCRSLSLSLNRWVQHTANLSYIYTYTHIHIKYLNLHCLFLKIYVLMYLSDSINQASMSEWAIGFSSNKYKSIFESIWLHDIPASETMVFYYCSSLEASRARKSGLPALKRFNGVPFTLRRPHLTTKNDFEVFDSSLEIARPFPHEELLVLSLPRRFLDPLKGFEEDEGLCMISADLLKALRPLSGYCGVADRGPWLNNVVLLSPHSIIRSFLILEKEDKMIDNPIRFSLDFVSDEGTITSIATPTSFPPAVSLSTYLESIGHIREEAELSQLVLMYHYTTVPAAASILKTGLRLPSKGEGGVYFSTQGPCSYGVYTSHYETNIIKEWFGIERLQELKGKGHFDAVIVYGCDVSILSWVSSKNMCLLEVYI
jgi:hypothetical protein